MANYITKKISQESDQNYQPGEGQGFFFVGNSSVLGDYDGATRFQNITIAQGTTVNDAILRIYVGGVGDGSGNLVLKAYGIDEDNTATFSTNPFGRDKTTAYTDNIDIKPTQGGWRDINVKNQVNEILARGGWASGNAIGFLVYGNGSASNVWAGNYMGNVLMVRIATEPNFKPTPQSKDAPTFPSTSNYGIRVSEPEVDVRTATEKQLYFTSRKKGLRILMQGYTEENKFTHGLDYSPGVLGFWTDTDGKKRIANYPYNMFSLPWTILSDDEYVWFEADNMYYYVFLDPLT
jgi:hypothetical protein